MVQPTPQRRIKHPFVIFLLLATSGACTVRNSGPPPEPTAERSAQGRVSPTASPSLVASHSAADDFHWRRRLANGTRLELTNPHGDFVIEPAKSAVVDIRATKQGRDADRVRIVVDDRGERLVVCVRYGEGEGCRNRSPFNGQAKVDFRVQLPPGTALKVDAAHGSITSRAPAPSLELNTALGDIELLVRGNANANTANGSIRARFIPPTNGASRLELDTVNGTVTLGVPADMSATLKASTVNGPIHSDLPVHRKTPSFVGDNASATWGAGTHEIELATVNGAIRVLRDHNLRSAPL